MKVAAIVLFGIVSCLLLPLAAAADCSRFTGKRVFLFADNYNPDVFVWDSKQRLLDYEAGSWQIARILLPHALLVRAGTPAVVLGCSANIVHPKYRLAPTDAVGVKVIEGSYRGRYGWVLLDDVHAQFHRQRARR